MTPRAPLTKWELRELRDKFSYTKDNLDQDKGVVRAGVVILTPKDLADLPAIIDDYEKVKEWAKKLEDSHASLEAKWRKAEVEAEHRADQRDAALESVGLLSAQLEKQRPLAPADISDLKKLQEQGAAIYKAWASLPGRPGSGAGWKQIWVKIEPEGTIIFDDAGLGEYIIKMAIAYPFPEKRP
jgi:hypothetical protein